MTVDVPDATLEVTVRCGCGWRDVTHVAHPVADLAKPMVDAALLVATTVHRAVSGCDEALRVRSRRLEGVGVRPWHTGLQVS